MLIVTSWSRNWKNVTWSYVFDDDCVAPDVVRVVIYGTQIRGGLCLGMSEGLLGKVPTLPFTDFFAHLTPYPIHNLLVDCE